MNIRPIDLGPRTSLQVLVVQLMHGTDDQKRKALKMLNEGPSTWDPNQKAFDL